MATEAIFFECWLLGSGELLLERSEVRRLGAGSGGDEGAEEAGEEEAGRHGMARGCRSDVLVQH